MKPTAVYKLKSRAKPYSNGFTLLEILVAIVVLSFGLLGMVGIQAMALKSNNDAKQQSAAVQLAGELSDMMRGNKAVSVLTTPTTNPYLIANYLSTDTITTPAENCSLTAGCTSPLNVASWEKSDWLTRVFNTFPGARVQVCFDDAPYTAGGIPQWGCSGAAAARGTISIKMGWSRESTNKIRVNTGNTAADTAANAANAYDIGANTRPTIIYRVTPGSSGI